MTTGGSENVRLEMEWRWAEPGVVHRDRQYFAVETLPSRSEHGGRCNDFVYEMVQSGIGMQSGPATGKVDFFFDGAFSRLDESDDDLYRSPILPFSDDEFDVVVCTASVEYLVHPVPVFDEIARCLKAGGRCMMTFSDRWFPPKVVQLWSELHPFERVALVTRFFQDCGEFRDIETLSIRCYPRPADDKYANQQLYSDPLFGVSGVAI